MTKQDELRELWDRLPSQRYRVLSEEVDDEGDEVTVWGEHAEVRQIDGTGRWLYVDDANGYSILEQAAVDGWTLEAAKEG